MAAQLSADRPRQGRPDATSHAEIEQAAFRLFARSGFDAATVDDIAREVGVSRRTLFRYFPSKNDIPWGRFDQTLDAFRDILRETPADVPLAEAISTAVAAYNTYPNDADPPHLERMRLILQTPALMAHSGLRYAAWRAVIAQFVAERTGSSASDPLPVLVGYTSLAVALAVYDEWIREPDAAIPDRIRERFAQLTAFFHPAG